MRLRRLCWACMGSAALALSLMPGAYQIAAGQELVIPQMATLTTNQCRQMPLAFTRNDGQWDSRVLFRCEASGMVIWCASDGIYYHSVRRLGDERGPGDRPPISTSPAGADYSGTLSDPQFEDYVIQSIFVDANPSPLVSGELELPHRCNYFIGNDPSGWQTDVPNYSRVVYEGLYPGIDLALYGRDGALEYDFVVHPGANPGAIAMRYDGVQSTLVDRHGALVLVTPWGELTQSLPELYEVLTDGRHRPIQGAFCVSDAGHVQFDVPERYDPALAVVIDPVLTFSTFIGGDDWDCPQGIAVDEDGNAYITGYTRSANYPVHDPYDPDFNGEEYDVFVTKLAAAGDQLVYSTYLGGTAYGQFGYGIAVDASGAAYITGNTYSADFPTLNAYDATYNNEWDAFVTKLAPAGNALVYSTFLGGTSHDEGKSIAVDALGRAHVAGSTSSPNFPVSSPYDGTHNGSVDIFLTKLSPLGNTLVYSTFLGGSEQDWGYGIALDSAGNAYVVGATQSNNWPTQNAYDSTVNGGNTDAVVASLSSNGATLRYSTYLGGLADEYGTCISASEAGHACVAGYTMSPNFPLENPYDATYDGSGSDDLFVTRFAPDGGSLEFSTYLGGTGQEYAQGNCITLDASDCLHVAGRTRSLDFPVFRAFDSTFNGGGTDAFLTRFTPSGHALVYSTFLGGGGIDEGDGVAVDALGYAYVIGWTSSTDFPMQIPYDGSFNGGDDVFVTKVSTTPPRGLLGHWSMNDPAGTTIIDSSGNNLTGEATGTTIATGPRGNARRFDGLDDHISVPDDFLMSIDDSITITMWIRPDGDFIEGFMLNKRIDGGGINYAVRAACKTGADSLVFQSGLAGEMQIAATANLDDGRWHFVGFSLNLDDVNSGRWVVDGLPVTTTSIGGMEVPPVLNTADLQIGRQLDASPRRFKGNIDEVRLYNRTLSLAELQALYQSTRWDHVTSLADAGPGTLRNAIAVANLSPGVDTIAFSIAGVAGITSALPALIDFTGGTAIRGFTAPGASIPDNPTFILDGSGCLAGSGLEVTASGGNLIEGLEIRGFPGHGILLSSVFSHCTIRENRIHSNAGIGIDLGGTGVTLNDAGDVDAGPNTLLNYPEIDTVRLVGQDSFYVAGRAAAESIVELYLAGNYFGGDTLTDSSGHGQGWQFLDSAVAHDVTGHFAFPMVESRAWSWITMTATDMSGNTSEFSLNRQLIPDSMVFTAYSPVTLTVIEPDGSDSIGPGFNTIGPTADYDSLTDYGIGPSGVAGEPDDRVTITNVQTGTYIIKVRQSPGEDGDGYFLGIRVDGTNEVYHALAGATSVIPITNPLPDEGETHEYGVEPAPGARGDLDANGYLDAVDLAILIDVVFFGSPTPQPEELSDINCDGFPDAVDLAVLIDHVFFGGPPPCL